MTKFQDKLAVLMLEDLRRILRKETDELLLPVYVQPIRELQSLNSIDCSFLSPDERKSAKVEGSVIYYTPDPRSWRQWIDDCLASLGL